MDAFYVNVHLLDNPADAGMPLIIGGRPEQRGVVSSASYEARRLGIRSAMPTSQAVRLCPRLKIVPANWPRIRACSRQVMAVLQRYGPVEQMSVDEAYVDLSAQPEPAELALRIRQTVKAETGLPASVGLATSKLVAKVASDFNKPEGYTVVLPGEEAAFLAPLPVRSLWGIGPRTTARLAELRITTCGELAKADLGTLQAVFGHHGTDLPARARGVDGRSVDTAHGQAKSISQERTFSTDVNDAAFLQEKLRTMSTRVAEELQQKQLVAHTVFVKFRWSDFTTFTRQKSLAVGIDDGEEIYRLALAIWQEHWPPGQRMRLLGVGVSRLEETAVRQLGFNFGIG